MASRRILSVLALVGVTALAGCVAPPAVVLVSPYSSSFPPAEYPLISLGGPSGQDVYTCTVGGGPVSVQVTGYDDPYGTDNDIVAWFYTQVDGTASWEFVGSHTFTYVGETVVTDALPAGECFHVLIHGFADAVYPPCGMCELIQLPIGYRAPGASFTVTW